MMTDQSLSPKRERALAVTVAALATWWILVLASDAEAYIDPSAGGMLVQLLLAGTAGVAVLGKLFWARIKRLFGASDAASTESKSPTTLDRPHDGV
jgi:hypothetical protein